MNAPEDGTTFIPDISEHIPVPSDVAQQLSPLATVDGCTFVKIGVDLVGFTGEKWKTDVFAADPAVATRAAVVFEQHPIMGNVLAGVDVTSSGDIIQMDMRRPTIPEAVALTEAAAANGAELSLPIAAAAAALIEARQDKIFDEFQRLHQEQTTNHANLLRVTDNLVYQG